MTTPQPPPESYLKKQNILRDGKPHHEIKKELMRIFADTFRLKAHNSLIAWRLQDELSRKFDGHLLMDHVEWFADRYKMCLVAVTQPYGTVEAVQVLEPRLQQLGVSLIDLNAWVWHYPGETTCWGLVVPQAARKLIQLRIDTHDYASELFAEGKSRVWG